MKEKILNAARIIILSAVLASAIGYSLADWVPPSGAPPLGNVPPPINVGNATQVKEGMLMINNRLVAKKARGTDTIVAADPGDTLVTKDYVDKLERVTVRSTTCLKGGSAYCERWAVSTCPAGKRILIGSCNGYGGGPANTFLYASGKDPLAESWGCYINNQSKAANGVEAVALCF